MAGLDTNVLVRLLVADDAAQLAQAKALVRSAQRNNETLSIPITVMLELEWVLRSRYGFSRNVIAMTMNHLLETRELAFQDEAALEQALFSFHDSKADFADCVHASLCAADGQSPLLTFDVQAARLPDTRLIESGHPQ